MAKRSTTVFEVPDPETRVPASMYLELRAWMLANDPDAQKLLDWASNEVAPPTTAEKMAYEIIWIILCAGRSAQAARTIERKVLAAIHAETPVVEAFGYRAKALAIERAWREREQDFAALSTVLATGSQQDLVQWGLAIPFIGDDTVFQLLKNFGAAVAKPDIWLCRLTGFADRPRRPVHVRFPACMALCQYLAQASGDSIAVIDTLLWSSCNKGVLVVDAQGGPVTFTPKAITARSILA